MPILARQTQSTLRSKRAVRSFCVYRNSDEWKGIYDSTHLPWQTSGRFKFDGQEFTVLEFDWSRRPLRDVLLSSWDQAERRYVPKGGHVPDTELSLGGQPTTMDELRVSVRDRVTQLGGMFKLTPREAEILEQLCLGETPEAIGRRLAIRPRTVKFHQENLLRKTGVASRAELFRKLL